MFYCARVCSFHNICLTGYQVVAAHEKAGATVGLVAVVPVVMMTARIIIGGLLIGVYSQTCIGSISGQV